VGALYEILTKLFDNTTGREFVAGDDIDAATIAFQARWDEWGLGDQNILIRQASSRDEALQALRAIAEQGEGTTEAAMRNAPDESHFERFLRIYRQFPGEEEWQPTIAVPINPNTNSQPQDPELEPGRITHPQSRRWAQLFNRRYRMLLTYLCHTFHVEAVFESDRSRSARGLLLSWAFGEMYNLKSIARFLAEKPLREGDSTGLRAGAPFEMPYTLSLPEREVDRWRLHRNSIDGSRLLIKEIQDYSENDNAEYLTGLLHLDAEARNTIVRLIAA
jgi:hypothetical protein